MTILLLGCLHRAGQQYLCCLLGNGLHGLSGKFLKRRRIRLVVYHVFVRATFCWTKCHLVLVSSEIDLDLCSCLTWGALQARCYFSWMFVPIWILILIASKGKRGRQCITTMRQIFNKIVSRAARVIMFWYSWRIILEVWFLPISLQKIRDYVCGHSRIGASKVTGTSLRLLMTL